MRVLSKTVAATRRPQRFPSFAGRCNAATRAARGMAVSLGLMLCAGHVQALELAEVVRNALASYPAIRVAQANRSVAALDTAQSEALHWPTVDVVGTGRLAGSAISAAQPRARLNLFASGAIEARIEREKLREAALLSTEHSTREDVAHAVVQAWLRVVRGEGQLVVALSNLTRHRELQKDFEAIAEIDPGRRYDLIQSRTRTEQVLLQVADREAEIALARAALARYTDGKLPEAALKQPATLPAPMSPAQMLARLDQHPAILAAGKQLDSAQANTRVARASRMPRLDLESTLGKDRGTQLLLSWPAFDRAADAAEQAANAQVGAESARLEEQRQLIAEEIRIARQEWLAVERRASIAASQVELANELAKTYREQFKIGRRNLLDLLNAFNELFQSESALAGAQIDRLLARYRIEYSTGRLAAVFVEGKS